MKRSKSQQSITSFFTKKTKESDKSPDARPSECSEIVKKVQDPEKESVNQPHSKEQIDVIATPSTSGIASKSET